MLLGADVTINTDVSGSTDNNVSFTSSIDGGHSLTITAGNGTATFGDQIGHSTPLSSLDVTAAAIALNAGSVSNALPARRRTPAR